MRPLWRTKQKKISPFLCCSVLSEIVLFHGKEGVTQERFDQLWKYDPYPPSVETLMQRIKVKNIKWYIHNFMEVHDPVWNASFIHGLATHGKIVWNGRSFPTFQWTCNTNIFEILRDSPFYGKTNEGEDHFMKWYRVPAFYLQPDPESISFMAGVLATGRMTERNGEIYADYNQSTLPYLRSFGIPIEYESEGNYHNLISPFWVAIFSLYMPECQQKWRSIKNAYRASLYAAILSRIYVSNKVDKNAFPYLKSRRWIYDHHGSMEQTEQLWLEMGLSQLDKRVRRTIESWLKTV